MFIHSVQKFLTFYQKLGKKDASAYRQFVKNMPGSGPAALELLDVLKKEPRDSEFKIGEICSKLYENDTKGGRIKVQNALSDLNLQMPKFLLYRKATDQSPESRWLWLAVLRDLDIRDEFSEAFGQWRQEVKAGSRENDLDYWKNAAVDQLALSYLGPSETGEYADLLRDFNQDLDLYYALAKLKTACLRVNARNLQGVNNELEHLAPPVGLINHPGLDAHPPILLYREVYRLLITPGEEQYSHIIALLNLHADAVDVKDLHLIVRYLDNYANRRIINGEEEYWKRVNDLNKFSHNRQIFLREGPFPTSNFINIVAAACNAGDLKWAHTFIAFYSATLPEADRDDVLLLSNATIAFEQKDFQRVLDHLELKDFEQLFANIRSRSLILRSLYECEENDGRVEDYCASFERYLRKHREEVAAQPVDTMINSVRIVRKLLEQKLTRDQLKTAIEETKPLYFKTWLLEKAARYPDHRM